MVYKSLKILQANVQNSRNATLEAKSFAELQDIDIVCIQEPYTYARRDSDRLSIPWHNQTMSSYDQSDKPYTATYSLIKQMDITFNSTLSGQHITADLLTFLNFKLLLINVYIPWDEDIQTYIDQINEIIHKYRQHQISIILLGDVNSKSAAWYSKQTNERGQRICKWII